MTTDHALVEGSIIPTSSISRIIFLLYRPRRANRNFMLGPSRAAERLVRLDKQVIEELLELLFLNLRHLLEPY